MLPRGMPEDDDHYGALGLEPGAERQEVRDAWRFLLAAFHPDRFRDPIQRERAEEITKRVNAAWQVLGDDQQRRRYDLRRAAAIDEIPPAAPVRELPCPTCAARVPAADAGGRMVTLTCPACGESFPAMIGAHCVERPRLERRLLRLRYTAVFTDAAGAPTAVTFRRLPQELALPEGELFSIVFHPRRPRPVYAIVHGDTLDVGWRVG